MPDEPVEQPPAQLREDHLAEAVSVVLRDPVEVARRTGDRQHGDDERDEEVQVRLDNDLVHEDEKEQRLAEVGDPSTSSSSPGW